MTVEEHAHEAQVSFQVSLSGMKNVLTKTPTGEYYVNIIHRTTR
jgi:hypothetical protein